jgi:iron complex outermembrane receptor protein
MKTIRKSRLSQAVRGALFVAAVLPIVAFAQDDTTTLDAVEVTGSRIKQTDAVTQAPVAVITRAQIDQSGVSSVGELLQQLAAGGKALNAKFNSSGNFGYPSDGGGIGAGSAQVDLRHLGSQRVLVLVDGIRWVNESSASGVSGSADLNTIPLAIIERVEVLEDGASAIYGSDAIAGVINIITRKSYDGVLVNTYYGEYEEGGETTEASITVGGSGERFAAAFSASYYEQQRIRSSSYGPASVPVPGAGPGAGSSGTPQGRYTFCDPSIPAGQLGYCDPAGEFWYDITLNDGTTTPVWDPNDPFAGTYHAFGAADRYNYAVNNLLLTPSERKSLFTNISYDISDNTSLHVKALYNNRTSVNQAAPEPIFVGPFAGTGGIADTVIIHENNPYNPFGIRLDPSSNFGWVTRRPIEVGPRIFEQDVDTWYFNVGLDGSFGVGDRGFDWDVNYVRSENSAEQVFRNGYNMAKIKLALGDPLVCAATPGCVPLDLFGGQGRPMTQEMINWIRTTQIDASKQTLQLVSANITGDLFDIGDRAAGFAAGIEHREYQGEFNPDPLRQTGESQDSFASPVDADYDVTELYAEMNLPLADTFDVSAALRYSDYSTFGNATTGKVGFRWQPVEDFVLRGTYSEGFRAPNLGELYGLTQFGATLTDPCGPTGTVVVDASDGLNTTPLETACRLQGVPNGFEQANTQITTFTGGNPDLDAEESESYTFGMVYNAGWAEDVSWSDRLDFELNYYHHEIDGAVQARDLQALLNACLAAGGDDPALCSPFTRGPSGNLNPPNNFLDNLGVIETDGIDVKVNWASPEWSWGRLTGSLQSTHVLDYRAVDSDGNVSDRQVGIEVNDSAIPDWQTNVQFGWMRGDWSASWNVRYISEVKESCVSAVAVPATGCAARVGFNELDATTYNDVQLAWNNAFTLDGLKFSLGVNNVFGEDPPICVTCSLNGYDAGTYDVPGRFWYLSMDYKF